MTDPPPDAVARVLAELDALLYGEDEDERLCNGAGDAYRAGDHSNRIFLTIGHILTLRDALAAREQEVAEMRHQRDSRMEMLADWDVRLGKVQDENAQLRAQLAAAQAQNEHVRRIIASNSFAASFQTLEQYRTALLAEVPRG